MIQKKSILTATIVLLLIVFPRNVNAHHYVYLTEDPNTQLSTPAGGYSSWPENWVFYRFYVDSWLDDDATNDMKVRLSLVAGGTDYAGDGVTALNSWSGLLPGHLDFATVSSNQDITIAFDTDLKCGIASGCFGVESATLWTSVSSWGVNIWQRSAIYVTLLFPFANGARASTIAHELVHALSLHEQYQDQGGFNCQNPNSSIHSIMEGTQVVSGKIQLCDATTPQTMDMNNVKRFWGYLSDSNQTYPGVAIIKSPSAITYQFNDRQWSDWTVEMTYWSSFSGYSGFTKFATTFMNTQPPPAPLNYYGNGIHQIVENRIFSQSFNPSNWGINNRWISVCAQSWYESGRYGTRTCSPTAIYWP